MRRSRPALQPDGRPPALVRVLCVLGCVRAAWAASRAASPTRAATRAVASRTYQATRVAARFTPGIPSMENNPFIEETSLPEGTLFIIFGAILGGIGFLVAMWRLVSLWIARKAAKDAEPRFAAGGAAYAPTYDHESDTSAKLRKPHAQHTMFYSPIAEVMKNGVTSSAQARGLSRSYLPAGYYGHTQPGPQPHSLSAASNASAGAASSLNVGRPKSFARPGAQVRRQRPPSAYLDELLRY